jgi:hypothetical protein
MSVFEDMLVGRQLAARTALDLSLWAAQATSVEMLSTWRDQVARTPADAKDKVLADTTVSTIAAMCNNIRYVSTLVPPGQTFVLQVTNLSSNEFEKFDSDSAHPYVRSIGTYRANTDSLIKMIRDFRDTTDTGARGSDFDAQVTSLYVSVQVGFCVVDLDWYFMYMCLLRLQKGPVPTEQVAGAAAGGAGAMPVNAGSGGGFDYRPFPALPSSGEIDQSTNRRNVLPYVGSVQ